MNAAADLLLTIGLTLLGAAVLFNTLTIRRILRNDSSVRGNLTTQETPGQSGNRGAVRAALTVKRGNR